MRPRSEAPPDWDGIRERFIGLNESFSVKSYYPQLKQRVAELEESRASLAALNDELEAKVRDRTEQLQAKIAELGDAQERLILSEKLAALGRLTAGIAHELNSPLGAVESSGAAVMEGVLRVAAGMVSLLPALPEDAVPVFLELVSAAMERAKKWEDRGDRARRKAAARRLAELGAPSPDELADYVDEIGAYDRAEPLSERFGMELASSMLSAAAEAASLVRSAAIIRHAAERAAVVVRALRNYGGEDRPETGSTDVDESLAVSAELYRDKFRLGARLILRLESGSRVASAESSLGQVWINLIGNALQAMEYSGTLEISSRRDGGSVVVEIADSGPGIPEAVRDRVFSPFFTTKAVGEGTGFGLVVAKRIVERAGGSIGFESRPGRTVFRVSLPAAGAAEDGR